MTLPAHTFEETDLMLAQEALLIVDAMLRRTIGESTGPEAIDRLNELAATLRAEENAGADSPGIACGWPFVESDGSGEMAFHVAAGGTEYDGITARWTIGADERLVLVYGYDGRDELYENRLEDGGQACGETLRKRR